MKYQRRPVKPPVFDAIQYEGMSEANAERHGKELTEFLGGNGQAQGLVRFEAGRMELIAEDGSTTVDAGDWIVRDAQGELSVYTATAFEKIYEPVPTE